MKIDVENIIRFLVAECHSDVSVSKAYYWAEQIQERANENDNKGTALALIAIKLCNNNGDLKTEYESLFDTEDMKKACSIMTLEHFGASNMGIKKFLNWDKKWK